MLYLRHVAPALALIAVMACTVLAPRGARSETKGDILKTPERLLGQERRQLDAGRRLSKVVRRIDWLLEDLKSNGLESEGGGDRYTIAKKQLTSVGNSDVPNAVESLRSARADLAGAYAHLDRADRQIEVIVTKLNLALGEASDTLLTDVALRELRQIIKQQEFLQHQTETLVENSSKVRADYQRVGKAQRVLAAPVSRLMFLLQDEGHQLDEDAQRRFTAAAAEIQYVPGNVFKAAQHIEGWGRDPLFANGIFLQGAILVRLRKAERILSGVEPDLAEVLKDLRTLLEELKQLKKDAEEQLKKEAETKAFELSRWHYFMLRLTKIKTGVATWVSMKAVEGGPMVAPLREADTALWKAQAGFQFVHHNEGHRKKIVNHMAEAIAALERALAEGEKQQAKDAANDAEINSDLEGKGDAPESEGQEGQDGGPLLGLEPGDKEQGAEPGEEQTAGGKKQRDKKLGDASKPPVDGEEVESASGSEGKPGDPGPSEFEGKGGPIGGGKVEEIADTGLSINANSEAERTILTGNDPEGNKSKGMKDWLFGNARTGGSDREFAFAGRKPGGAQTRDAVSRRRRSAAIKKYVEQLPPEFRQQVADYYEALAK